MIRIEVAETLVLLSGKFDKYKYFTGEGIFPSNQSEIIEQTKFCYSTLEKAFEKQRKTIEDGAAGQKKKKKKKKKRLKMQLKHKQKL